MAKTKKSPKQQVKKKLTAISAMSSADSDSE